MEAGSCFVVATVLLISFPGLGTGSDKDPIVAEATSKESFVLAEFTSKTCPACVEMRAVVAAVLARHPAVRHQIHDADLEVDLSKKYRVRCVPVYVVVDPEGQVQFNDVGMFAEKEFEEILHRAGVAPH